MDLHIKFIVSGTDAAVFDVIDAESRDVALFGAGMAFIVNGGKVPPPVAKLEVEVTDLAAPDTIPEDWSTDEG